MSSKFREKSVNQSKLDPELEEIRKTFEKVREVVENSKYIVARIEGNYSEFYDEKGYISGEKEEYLYDLINAVYYNAFPEFLYNKNYKYRYREPYEKKLVKHYGFRKIYEKCKDEWYMCIDVFESRKLNIYAILMYEANMVANMELIYIFLNKKQYGKKYVKKFVHILSDISDFSAFLDESSSYLEHDAQIRGGEIVNFILSYLNKQGTTNPIVYFNL